MIDYKCFMYMKLKQCTNISATVHLLSQYSTPSPVCYLNKKGVVGNIIEGCPKPSKPYLLSYLSLCHSNTAIPSDLLQTHLSLLIIISAVHLLHCTLYPVCYLLRGVADKIIERSPLPYLLGNLSCI